MQGPSACLAPGCPVKSDEDDENSKYNAMPLRMGYAVCMRHFQKYDLLDRNRLTAAVSATAASTITVYYNFQTTHPVGNEVYELAAVTDQDGCQPFFCQVSTAVQGPYNQVNVGVTLRAALSDFLEWLRQLACQQQHSQMSSAPSQQDPQGHGHLSIILVAHYGACFAHEILVQGLRDHGLLASASHLRLCDSLITFKALLGKTSPCKLPYLAYKHAPKFEPPLGCARSHAVALREVSNAILSSKPFLPNVMWRMSDCPLPGFAGRIGISMPQQPAVQDAAQQNYPQGGIDSAASEALGSQSSTDTALPSPASPSRDAAIKEEFVKEESPSNETRSCSGRGRDRQHDSGHEPAPKRRAVGTLVPAPERLGPTTPPAISCTQPRCSACHTPPSMQTGAGRTSCHAAAVKIEQPSSILNSTPQAATADISLPATQQVQQADGLPELEPTQLAKQPHAPAANVSSVSGMQLEACGAEEASFPRVKIEQPTQAQDGDCGRPITSQHEVQSPAAKVETHGVKTEVSTQPAEMA